MYLQLKYLTVYALGQGIQRTYGFQIVSISAHVRRSVPVVFRQSLAGQAFPPSALYEQSYQSLLLTPRGLQAGHVHVQDAARPDTTVLVGRLSAHLRRKSPTTVVRHVYICRATDQNSSGWQIICCCWTTDMEQSAGRSAPSWQLCSL